MPRPLRPSHGDPDWDAYLETVFDDIYSSLVRPLFISPGSATASPTTTAISGQPVVPLATWTAALPDVGPLFTTLTIDVGSTMGVVDFTVHGDGSTIDLLHDGLYRLGPTVGFGNVHLSGVPVGAVEVQVYMQNAVNPAFDPSTPSDLSATVTDALQDLTPTSPWALADAPLALSAASYAFYIVVITHDPLDDGLTWSLTDPVRVDMAELLRSP